MDTSRDENKEREAAKNDPRQLSLPLCTLEQDPYERDWYYDRSGTKRHKETGHKIYE